MVINQAVCKYKGRVYYVIFPGGDMVWLESDSDYDYTVRGFVKNKSYNGVTGRYHKYYKKEKVHISDIDWFCYVFTVGYYKGCKVHVTSEENGKYQIDIFNVADINSDAYKVFTEKNAFKKFDRYDWYGDVPKSEVQNIVQMVKPARPSLKAPDKWDFQIPGDDNEFPRRVVPYE